MLSGPLTPALTPALTLTLMLTPAPALTPTPTPTPTPAPTPALFLRLNGYRLIVKAEDAERFMIDDVIAGFADLQKIAGWISERMHPLS